CLTVELDNNRHSFCSLYQQLDGICSIVGCDQPVVPGKKACSDSRHSNMERLHYERGRATFILQ
ncbi:hypothetical protein C8R44DRAFT_549036, partial [Mycena epipterygia]